MFEKLCEIIAGTLNCDAAKITMDTDLFNDLGADSLDAVEVNLAIEEEFKVSIPDEEMANVKTVADIMKYLEAEN